jgi:hypothetical protein
MSASNAVDNKQDQQLSSESSVKVRQKAQTKRNAQGRVEFRQKQTFQRL